MKGTRVYEVKMNFFDELDSLQDEPLNDALNALDLDEWNKKVKSILSMPGNDMQHLEHMMVLYKSLLPQNKKKRDKMLLKVKILRHINFFYFFYLELRDEIRLPVYFDLMEDILAYYCTLEFEILKKNSLFKGKIKQSSIYNISQKLIYVINTFLESRDVHVHHVLLKIKYNSKFPILKSVMNLIFKHFLLNTPIIEETDESFCRYYILFCKYKALLPENFHADLDNRLSKNFVKYDENYVKENYFLKTVLTRKFKSLSDMLWENMNIEEQSVKKYFKTFNELKSKFDNDEHVFQNNNREANRNILGSVSQNSLMQCKSEPSSVIEILSDDEDDDCRVHYAEYTFKSKTRNKNTEDPSIIIDLDSDDEPDTNQVTKFTDKINKIEGTPKKLPAGKITTCSNNDIKIIINEPITIDLDDEDDCMQVTSESKSTLNETLSKGCTTIVNKEEQNNKTDVDAIPNVIPVENIDKSNNLVFNQSPKSSTDFNSIKVQIQAENNAKELNNQSNAVDMQNDTCPIGSSLQKITSESMDVQEPGLINGVIEMQKDANIPKYFTQPEPMEVHEVDSKTIVENIVEPQKGTDEKNTNNTELTEIQVVESQKDAGGIKLNPSNAIDTQSNCTLESSLQKITSESIDVQEAGSIIGVIEIQEETKIPKNVTQPEPMEVHEVDSKKRDEDPVKPRKSTEEQNTNNTKSIIIQLVESQKDTIKINTNKCEPMNIHENDSPHIIVEDKVNSLKSMICLKPNDKIVMNVLENNEKELLEVKKKIFASTCDFDELLKEQEKVDELTINAKVLYAVDNSNINIEKAVDNSNVKSTKINLENTLDKNKAILNDDVLYKDTKVITNVTVENISVNEEEPITTILPKIVEIESQAKVNFIPDRSFNKNENDSENTCNIINSDLSSLLLQSESIAINGVAETILKNNNEADILIESEEILRLKNAAEEQLASMPIPEGSRKKIMDIIIGTCAKATKIQSQKAIEVNDAEDLKKSPILPSDTEEAGSQSGNIDKKTKESGASVDYEKKGFPLTPPPSDDLYQPTISSPYHNNSINGNINNKSFHLLEESQADLASKINPYQEFLTNFVDEIAHDKDITDDFNESDSFSENTITNFENVKDISPIQVLSTVTIPEEDMMKNNVGAKDDVQSRKIVYTSENNLISQDFDELQQPQFVVEENNLGEDFHNCFNGPLQLPNPGNVNLNKPTTYNRGSTSAAPRKSCLKTKPGRRKKVGIMEPDSPRSNFHMFDFDVEAPYQNLKRKCERLKMNSVSRTKVRVLNETVKYVPDHRTIKDTNRKKTTSRGRPVKIYYNGVVPTDPKIHQLEPTVKIEKMPTQHNTYASCIQQRIYTREILESTTKEPLKPCQVPDISSWNRHLVTGNLPTPVKVKGKRGRKPKIKKNQS